MTIDYLSFYLILILHHTDFTVVLHAYIQLARNQKKMKIFSMKVQWHFLFYNRSLLISYRVSQSYNVHHSKLQQDISRTAAAVPWRLSQILTLPSDQASPPRPKINITLLSLPTLLTSLSSYVCFKQNRTKIKIWDIVFQTKTGDIKINWSRLLTSNIEKLKDDMLKRQNKIQ